MKRYPPHRPACVTPINRRNFLKYCLTGSGGLALNAFPYPLYAGKRGKFAHDRIALGDTGIEVSRLAVGTGTQGINGKSNQIRKLGTDGVADLLHAAYDDGINFWDTADQYGTHHAIKIALKRLPREKVVILTKTHAASEAAMKADLDRFRRELGTDYLDIVLLHCMRHRDWPTRQKAAMEILSVARENGMVKALGVSCHTLDALKAAEDSDWVQVNLARSNPAGIHMDSDPHSVIKVLRRMKASGKAVIGIKILGAGKLRNQIDESLQYTLSHECIDCFSIGLESRDEMSDLIKRIPAASVRG